MNDVWFVSDNHFWHDNILHWCRDTRRGDSVEEMNELMIEAHNSVVKPGHRVYCLGDLCFGGKAKIHSILPRLNGDIHLILGNHDGMISKSKEFHQYFTSIQKSKHLKVGEHRFSLTHTPQAEWVDCHKGVIALHGHCFDEDTEILTQDGWKSRRDVSPNEVVATLNTDTCEIEYQRSLSKTEYHYEGRMQQYDGSRINFLLTPEHRILNRGERGSALRFNIVDEMPSTAIIPLVGRNTQEDFDIPDLLLRLYINICADGSFENSNLVRFHLKKDRKINRLTSILNALGIEFSKNKQKSGSTKINFRRPSSLEGFSIKPLDRELLTKLSKRQVDIVVDEYSLTDGCLTGENSVQISTSKECEADLLQEVFITSEVSCNKVKTRNGGYVLSLNKSRKELLFRRVRMESVEYVGYVWCMTVPNSTLVVRRGGKVHISGNCHGDKTNVQWQQKFKFFDVGIDNRGDDLMLPWNMEEVLEIVKNRDIMSHH